jgi:ParB family chromosome partitioning protein
MSRKDSRGMFANVLGPLDEPASSSPAARITSPHLLKVAAGVRQIQEKGETLDRILKDGEHIVEIEPEDIAPSTITDRFDGAYQAAAIEELTASMRERGQIVPGLVRPVRGGDKPYQIVFGRRRLAAAKFLGVKFKAVLRDLTDDEAIVFQGEENANRNDLSFVEKCAFALSQDQAGYRREVICAALATGKSHISEMLQIAAVLPREVLYSIGAAPDIGRRRWVSFADDYAAHTDAAEIVSTALKRVSDADSNQRFHAAQAALRAAHKAPLILSRNHEVHAGGFLLATVSYPNSGARLSFTKAVPAEFVDFLTDRMEALHSEFMQTRNPMK